MPSDLYKKVINDRIERFFSECNSAELISNPGIKGDIRESGLGKLISELLPIDWGIGSGQIIDSKNNNSAQTDLIIYYKRVLPPIFYNIKDGFFPIESCGFAIEVKTKSTATEIKSSIKKFNKLKRMKVIRSFSENPHDYSLKPIRVYFAADTDLKVQDDFLRYIELDNEYVDDPAIQVICVVGKGIWFFQEEEKYGKRMTNWVFYPNNQNHEEMILLICGIINQIISIITLGWLNFNRYFMDVIDELKMRKYYDINKKMYM